MKIALLSDIHGNSLALDAVLADAQSIRVEAYWSLGDHVAIGPEPVAVLDRLAELEDVTFVRGNTDRHVVAGEGPPTMADESTVRPDARGHVDQIAASFAWTRENIAAHGWLDWLAALPVEQRTTLSDGTRMLAAHASPGTDDGDGIHPGRSNAGIEELIAGCEADLVCVGHTHEPVDRQLAAARVVNPGCVSNPIAPDLRASYAIIDASNDGYDVHHRRVAYDHHAFIDMVRRSHHPAAEFIINQQLGVRPARTPHPDHTGPTFA